MAVPSGRLCVGMRGPSYGVVAACRHSPVPTVPQEKAVARPRDQVREATLALLRSCGMTTIFGNPGTTALPFLLDFPSDFRYVVGLQESVVVGMAGGYAHATHNANFVNLHSAASVGHAMGSIFTAHKNRTPMVITAGQQARSMLPFEPLLFSAQATELPKPYVRWSVEPTLDEAGLKGFDADTVFGFRAPAGTAFCFRGSMWFGRAVRCSSFSRCNRSHPPERSPCRTRNTHPPSPSWAPASPARLVQPACSKPGWP